MPYWAAASVTVSWWATILAITTRFFDMIQAVTYVATHETPIACRLCPEPKHRVVTGLETPLDESEKAGIFTGFGGLATR